jgi:hypothetical protein
MKSLSSTVNQTVSNFEENFNQGFMQYNGHSYITGNTLMTSKEVSNNIKLFTE